MAQHVISPFDNKEWERPAPPGGASQQALPAEVPQRACSRWRLWIIDDSPTIRALTAHHLRAFPLEVRGFATGTDAIRALLTDPEHTPDLVLLDLELPECDGFQVARALRSLTCCAKTTIIMVSGRDRGTGRLEGQLADVDAYLVKPLTAEKVAALVTEYLPLFCLPQHASTPILREQMG